MNKKVFSLLLVSLIIHDLLTPSNQSTIIVCINKPNMILADLEKRSTLNAKRHLACFFYVHKPSRKG